MTMDIISQAQATTLPDGRTIGFATYGDSQGTPIFYFHGFPGSRLAAGWFAAIAASHHYRLIGVDRPGMGLSSIDKKRSIVSWPTDVANLANHLGIEKFSIVGHSGGGPFVAACAYAIPERLNGAAIVAGMVPMDYLAAKRGMSCGQRITNQLLMLMPPSTTIAMKLTYFMLKHPHIMLNKMIQKLPEADQALFRNPETRREIMNSAIEAFRQGVAGPAYEMTLLLKPWGFRLEDIRYPITLWQGRCDMQVPVSHAKIYADALPHAKLHLFENVGHHSVLFQYAEEIFNECQHSYEK